MTTVPVVPMSAHPLARPHASRAQGTHGDFDLGDREDGLIGGDTTRAEDTFNIRGRHSERPEDGLLGGIAKPVV